ncbi:MAG: RNA polymerase sigma factor [Microthrixaceae bacterium]
MDEQAIVERAVAGDRDAFHRLYEQNAATVFAFIRNRVGTQPAEDLTAETFCRAYEHLPQYEWRGVPFRAWLLRIAYHLVVARSRSRTVAELPVAEPLPPEVPSHEDLVVGSSENESLRVSLATLSLAHQTVLDLRFLREFSVAETATALDTSEEAVRALTYRALKALRAAHLGRAGTRAGTEVEPVA